MFKRSFILISACFLFVVLQVRSLPAVPILLNGASITGKVTDEAGKPLAGANVRIVGTQFGSATDKNGVFKINEITPDQYVVEASFIGYVSQSSSVTLVAEQAVTVNFSLKVDVVELNQITVTSRKRAESLQEVPVAVNAYSLREIEQAGIERPGDFIQLTPNVSLVESQNAGTSFMTIRGLTQVRNGESPVAVVIDGVLMVNTNQFTQELFDVEQIEVLKGPQGALYGRNAIGGAINITTRQPTNDLEGLVRLGTGNGDRGKALAILSGPLVRDKLYFSAAGSYLNHEGYIENIFLKTKVDQFRDRSGRLKLKWLPSENATVELRGWVSKTDGGALNFVLNSDFAGGDFIGDADDTSVPIESNILSRNDRTLANVSAKLEISGRHGTLSAVSAYDKVEEYVDGDALPYLRTPANTQSQYLDVDAFSQEIRFTSPDDRKFRWLVGGYFLKTDRFISTATGVDVGQGIIVRRERNPIDDPINPLLAFFADDNSNTAYAVFAQANVDLTDQVELSAALRYDKDNREQTDKAPASANFNQTRKTDFDRLQPKVTLRFAPSANFTLFGLYSEGFRSGGFNQAGIADVATQAGLVGVRDIFNKETSKNFELGFKALLFDNLLSVNGGFFKTRVTGQHYFSFIGAVSAQILTNIDKVDLLGGELEVMAQPHKNLTLYAAGGFTDSEIKKYAVDPTAVGNKAPYIPKTTFNTGFQFQGNYFGDFIRPVVRLDLENRGKQFWDPTNLSHRKSITLVNARFGFERPADWSLMAWVKNLTDLKYNSEFVLGGFAHLAQPRTFGVDFTKRF